MKLRWEDEVAPWQPPTDMTAPGALFNQLRRVRIEAAAERFKLYSTMMLYGTGFISKSTARTGLFTNISGV